MEFFESVYGERENVKFEDKVVYLQTTCHFCSFRKLDAKSLDEINAKIRTCLGSQIKRFEGLILLHQIVEQCSSDAIISNAVPWTQLALKVLKKNEENCGCRKLAFRVLSSILKKDEIRKEISTVLPGILETVLSVSIDDEWIEYAVSCLAICLQNYPRLCGLKKDKIKEFINFLLDNWNLREIDSLATCFCHFQVITFEGRYKMETNTVWLDQIEQFICSLHSILNSVVMGTEITEVTISRETKSTSLLSKPLNPFIYALKEAQHFKAVGQCLAKMLVTKIASNTAIPVDGLVSFISRTFSVTSADFLQTCSPYTSVIPLLHLVGLTILESIVLSCGQYLLANNILKMLIQVLKANESQIAGLQSQFCMVRCAVYRVFQTCIQKLKFGQINFHVFSSMVIKDMKPSRSEMELLPDNFAVKSSSMEKNMCVYATNTCIEALKTLKAFTTFGHNSLEVHKDIYSAVKYTVLQIQQNPLDIPIPYRNNDRCQVELYKLLSAASIKVYRHHHSIVHSSLALFSCALEGSNTKVSQVIQEEFNILNILIRTSVKEDLKPVDQTERKNSRNKFIYEITEEIVDEDSEDVEDPLDKVNGEDMDRVNGIISSPSQNSVLSSEEDIIEHCSEPHKMTESEECVEKNFKNAEQNGLNSDSDQECRKRSISNPNSEVPPPKKVAVNVNEEEEYDIFSMIEDFAPMSPDDEA